MTVNNALVVGEEPRLLLSGLIHEQFADYPLNWEALTNLHANNSWAAPTPVVVCDVLL